MGDSNKDTILSVYVAVVLPIEGRVFSERTVVLPNHDFVQARPGLAITGLAVCPDVLSIIKHADEVGGRLEPMIEVHVGFRCRGMGGEMHAGLRCGGMGVHECC